MFYSVMLNCKICYMFPREAFDPNRLLFKEGSDFTMGSQVSLSDEETYEVTLDFVLGLMLLMIEVILLHF
jgi:hypothetical protein